MTIRSLLSLLLLILVPALSTAQPSGESEDSPVNWPQEQFEFVFDGPGFLVSRERMKELREMSVEERGAEIEAFLAEDPIPETPENELLVGIERRQHLARAEYPTMLDHRARVVFLSGRPDGREIIECGATLKPLEIWRYGEQQLVLYQPRPGRPYRLWQPYDSKLALYNEEMADLLIQLAQYGVRRRIDARACEDVRKVDVATGIEGLRRFKKPPQVSALTRFVAPPADLAAWSRQAAATPLAELAPVLATESIDLVFPARDGQRMVARTTIILPADVDLEPFVDDDRSEYRLVIAGVVEQDGQLFEDFRIRFKLPPPESDDGLALAFTRSLRPDRDFVLRFRLEDEIGGSQVYVSRGFTVPKEPQEVAEIPVPEDLAVTMGEELKQNRIAGVDSLLLVPPVGDLVLGVWRADVLVTGERIQRVVFMVDDEEQLTRASPPFTAEVKLARYPREQVIRVEGYDAGGTLVASDEVSINQPRGSFKVRIVEPRVGVAVSGTVEASAEITIPEERRIERVEFRLNDELIQELTRAPWAVPLAVPEGGQTTYVSVAAILDDGSRAEDVRFLNSPQYLEEVDVNFVELLTTVLDGQRRPVPGLESGDFTVLEDGRPQTLAKFERVENLPLAVGITIDTSGSMAMLLPEAQRAAVDFLNKVLTPRDKAFAVGFAKEPILLIPPTDDVGAVEAALGDLQSLGWTALHDAVVSSLYYFRGLSGRKALILLSDGNDSASFYPFRDALEYARRSGVVIYTIGLNVRKLATEIRGKLKTLARETGGQSFFIERATELSSVYSQIEMELRSQYLLAYNSDAPPGDSEQFRAVEVKVKGGRKARTIAGYYP